MLLSIIIIGGLACIYLFFRPGKTSSTSPHLTNTTAATATVPQSTTSTTVIDKGPYGVGLTTINLVEQNKYLCAPHGATTGCKVRSMPLYVRYPTTGTVAQEVVGASPYRGLGPYPLIVFGVGYLEPVSSYSDLLDYWTSKGYIVAAPEFPLSQTSSIGGPWEADILNQPGDIAASINLLMKENVTKSSPLFQLINGGKIALAGQSDGGDAALASGYNTCCAISNVSAVISLSGAELSSYPGKYFTGGGPPLLISQGTDDSINLPADSQAAFNAAPSPKYYLNLLGADHLEAYQGSNPYSNVVEHVTAQFLNEYLKGTPGSLANMNSDGNVPGIATLN